MRHRVVLIPGDGIGPEVARAARRVVDATEVEIDWDVRSAGASVMERHGTPLPDEALSAIREARTALKGPITTPVGTGFRSVNVGLRQDLDLFAAVRPARHYPGVPTRHPGVDLVTIRENTEDLYQGIEFEVGSVQTDGLREALVRLAGYRIPDDAGVTVKPISVTGTRRIVRFALDYARRNGRKRVVLGHKANIMRFSDGVFVDTARQIDRDEYPDIDIEEMQVDQLAMTLVQEPETFEVVLLPNLYGDIISDLAAGLTGGLGLAAGANLGWEFAVFEPVHGSAPDIAGQGIANPLAMILTAAMLLAHLAEPVAAARVERAVAGLLEEGGTLTPDMGGTATTDQVTEAVTARLQADRP